MSWPDVKLIPQTNKKSVGLTKGLVTRFLFSSWQMVRSRKWISLDEMSEVNLMVFDGAHY